MGQALLRGGAAGAASSGINYLSDALDTRKIREDALRRMAQGSVSPYARRSDLSGLCSVPDPFAGGVGYPAVRGYRYEGHTGTAGKGGFNLADFGKELLTGFVAGGLSSAAFYGAGKAVEAVKGSVRSAGRRTLDIWDMPEGGGIINGRAYSQHAMERMAPDTLSVRAELSRRAEMIAKSRGLKIGTLEYYQFCRKYVDPRNIPPSVVEDAIRNTVGIPGHTSGTIVHRTADVAIVVNESGKVITVIRD